MPGNQPLTPLLTRQEPRESSNILTLSHLLSCATRPSSIVRETMSHSGRRIGTDSIPPRPRFGSNYGALPWLQTADQRRGQRPDRYRTVAPRGNGRPTSAARCRTKRATCRLSVNVNGVGSGVTMTPEAASLARARLRRRR